MSKRRISPFVNILAGIGAILEGEYQVVLGNPDAATEAFIAAIFYGFESISGLFPYEYSNLSGISLNVYVGIITYKLQNYGEDLGFYPQTISFGLLPIISFFQAGTNTLELFYNAQKGRNMILNNKKQEGD